MKISNEEVGHILQSRQVSLTVGSMTGSKAKSDSSNQQTPAASVELSGKAKDIQKARQAVQQAPEIRDNLVNNLKSRIESGTYQVSGSDIADLMIRRSYADQIR
jgi:negative regulator of flagellin synthesis FlgM